MHGTMNTKLNVNVDLCTLKHQIYTYFKFSYHERQIKELTNVKNWMSSQKQTKCQKKNLLF